MAYDYDTDILAALWTGGEDAEAPYAALIAANPNLFDEASETRILSTIEALRSHMEVLSDRDEARLFHFCISTMLEGFGSGGFIYGGNGAGAENAVAEGNVPNPVFGATDDIEIAVLDGVSGGISIAVVAVGGTDVAAAVAAINGTVALTTAGITAARTQDGRLRITQVPVGGATAAAGFVVTQGEGAANDLMVAQAGIGIQPPSTVGLTEGGLVGGIFLPKVIQVANAARDRAVRVFLGQIRNPALT
jgi:hypothetical protein